MNEWMVESKLNGKHCLTYVQPGISLNQSSSRDSEWIQSVIAMADGYEVQAVEQFMDRMIRLAQSKLPARLNRRVDAEDIVQSVFMSFFHRNKTQKFDIGSSNDLWRLLAAMTYRKTMTAIEFHSRQRRDYARESENTKKSSHLPLKIKSDDPTASAIAVMVELLDQILEQLPNEHQRILQLRLEDYSIDEIADKAQVSTRTVNRALKSARQIALELVERNE